MKFQPAGPERYAHQRRGLKKLVQNKGVGALLFDPGTGKTATTLDYVSVLGLASKREEIRVLVICPLAGMDTWVSQSQIYVAQGLNVWAESLGGSLEERAEALAARGGHPFRRSLRRKPMSARRARRMTAAHPRALHYDRSWSWAARTDRAISHADGPDGLGTSRPRIVIEVLNFDTFSSRRERGSSTVADLMLRAIERYAPDLVVVDESHKIKGASSNVSRFMARLSSRVPRRILLTGTVMPHSPLDVYGQWRFLDPMAFSTVASGKRKPASFGEFKDRYARLGGYMGREVIGYQNLDDMQDTMAQLAIVARKEDSLDLPPVSDVIVPVRLSTAEEAAYVQMSQRLVASMGSQQSTARNRLTQLMRLRQITSGYLPDDNGQNQVIGQSKLRVIQSLVEDTLAGEKRIVIFCNFTAEILELSRLLQAKGTRVDVIRGGVSSEERIAIRQRFGSDSPERIVLVAQISTLSLAVNELVTASHAIFGSLTQRRDDLVQARDRLNRVGQTKPVTYWYAISPGTVDEVIWKSIQQRSNLEAAMLSHITQVAQQGSTSL